MSDIPEYRVYALRYATRSAMRKDHFIGGDPHDGPMPMDYYVWTIAGPTGVIVVDTGFTAEVGAERKRQYLAQPTELLKQCGIEADEVSDVVLTHLHYDHAGNLDRFANAVFHVQEEEVSYATGRYMCFHRFRHGYEVDDVVEMVRLVYKDRVRFYKGDSDLLPGITLHRIGGHTAGLQCVRVHTARGWVVLASDTAHFYENFETNRPFSSVFHVGEMLEGFNRLKELADTPNHIIPGHDPAVMNRYPAEKGLEGKVVRLDLPPLQPCPRQEFHG